MPPRLPARPRALRHRPRLPQLRRLHLQVTAGAKANLIVDRTALDDPDRIFKRLDRIFGGQLEQVLDTNAVSALVGGHAPAMARRLFLRGFCISVVTEAEMRFGLARRPQKAAFRASLERMLDTIDIRPLTSATARRYGPLRAQLAALGEPLGPLWIS